MIEKAKFNDTFYQFPYKPRHEDGLYDNYGGIDLSQEPHRIDEIPEIQPYPALKQAIYQLNTQTPLMSLGIALWQTEHEATGYIQITGRQPDFGLSPEFLLLDEYFVEWVKQHYPENLEMTQAFQWEWADVHVLSQNAPSRMLSIYCLGRDLQALADGLTWVCSFLNTLKND